MRTQSAIRALMLALGLAVTGLHAQQAPLNPTVKVRPAAASAVPADCDESLAPQPAPRIRVEEIPAPAPTRAADLQVPPSRGLRDQLAEVQAAVLRNDRTAFGEWLTLAKAAHVSHPAGGERTAAAAAIAVYDDVARLWDYQFSSPTGAFFDATVQNGSLLAAMQKYPGYEEFIARQTITDGNGTRFYPTRETRDFLARTAGQRLERLGVRAAASRPSEPGLTTGMVPPRDSGGTTARSTPTTRQTPPETVTRSTTRRTGEQTTVTPSTRRRPTRKTTTSARSSSGRRASSSPSTKVASARTTTSRRSAGDPAPADPAPAKPAPAKRSPAPVITEVVPPSEDEIPIPAGVVSDPGAPVSSPDTPVSGGGTAPATSVATTTGGSPDAGQPVVAQSGTAQTEETTSTTSAATETAPLPVTQPRGRNLVFPLLLILIGVGVLILLFRASA